MRFLHPEMASWFLALPLAFACWVLHVRAKRRFRRLARLTMPGPSLRSLSRLSSARRDGIALVAGLAALGSLALAAMRPQIFIETRVPEYERQDLVLILDRSVSMRAEDIRPSRFGRAIQEIKTLLAHKPEGIDRVGLVGFAGSSLILSHLTSDVESLFFYLDWIGEDPEIQFGTDIGSALASAEELARKDDRPTRKIFLVLSDGDDHGSRLTRVLASLRDEHTRVYSIGIGSEVEAMIPIARAGGATTFLQDERGHVLTTRFDESTLRTIAAVTGGRYFRSTSGTDLAAAMREVARQERRLVGWTTATEYRDLYRELLLVAAVAATVALLTL